MPKGECALSITGWSLVRFLHVVAAMTWVGGQILLSVVVLPVLRGHLEPEQRGPLVRAAATRFARIANRGLFPILIASGTAMAWHRGVSVESLTGPGYGRLLGLKLLVVTASIVLAVVHGRMATARPKLARPLALAGLGAALTIVVFATALVP